MLKTLEDTFNAAGTMRVHGEAKREGIFQLVFSEQEFSEITARLEEHNIPETDN